MADQTRLQAQLAEIFTRARDPEEVDLELSLLHDDIVAAANVTPVPDRAGHHEGGE